MDTGNDLGAPCTAPTEQHLPQELYVSLRAKIAAVSGTDVSLARLSDVLVPLQEVIVSLESHTSTTIMGPGAARDVWHSIVGDVRRPAGQTHPSPDPRLQPGPLLSWMQGLVRQLCVAPCGGGVEVLVKALELLCRLAQEPLSTGATVDQLLAVRGTAWLTLLCLHARRSCFTAQAKAMRVLNEIARLAALPDDGPRVPTATAESLSAEEMDVPALVRLCTAKATAAERGGVAVKGAAVEMLGLLSRRYGSAVTPVPGLKDSIHKSFRTVAEQLLASAAPSQSLGSAFFRGVSDYLVGFPLHYSRPTEQESLALFFEVCMRAMRSAPSASTHSTTLAALGFLQTHACHSLAELLHAHTIDLFPCLEQLWTHKNTAVHRAAYPAVVAFLHAVAGAMSKDTTCDTDGSVGERLSFLRRVATSYLHEPAAGVARTSLALTIVSAMAGPLRCLDAPGNLREVLTHLLERMHTLLRTAARPASGGASPFRVDWPAEVVRLLPHMFTALAAFTEELTRVPTAESCTRVVHQLIDTMLASYPSTRQYPRLRAATGAAVLRLLAAARAVCPGAQRCPLVDGWCDYAAARTYQLALAHDSHAQPQALTPLEVAGTYAEWWSNVLSAATAAAVLQDTARQGCAAGGYAGMAAACVSEAQLRLSTALHTAAQRHLTSWDLSLTDALTPPAAARALRGAAAHEMDKKWGPRVPRRPTDYRRFLLLVHLYTELCAALWAPRGLARCGLKRCRQWDAEEVEDGKEEREGAALHEHLSDWLVTLVKLSRRYPHASGLLQLLHTTLQAAAPMGRESDGVALTISEQARHAVQLHWHTCHRRMYGREGELHYQCAMFILVAAPLVGVRDGHADIHMACGEQPMLDALQTVLAAPAPLPADETYTRRTARDQCAVLAVLARCLRATPALAIALLPPLMATVVPAGSGEHRRCLEELAAAHGVPVGRRGEVGAYGAATAPDWCMERHSLLRLPTLGEATVPVAIYQLVRPVAHVCLHGTSPAEQLAACELLRAVVAWLVDRRAGGWCREVLPTVVALAAGGGAGLAEHFQRLLWQLTRWFASAPAADVAESDRMDMEGELVASHAHAQAGRRQAAAVALRSYLGSLGPAGVDVDRRARVQQQLQAQLATGGAVASLSCATLLQQLLCEDEGRGVGLAPLCGTPTPWLRAILASLETLLAPLEGDDVGGVWAALATCLDKLSPLLRATSYTEDERRALQRGVFALMAQASLRLGDCDSHCTLTGALAAVLVALSSAMAPDAAVVAFLSSNDDLFRPPARDGSLAALMAIADHVTSAAGEAVWASADSSSTHDSAPLVCALEGAVASLFSWDSVAPQALRAVAELSLGSAAELRAAEHAVVAVLPHLNAVAKLLEWSARTRRSHHILAVLSPRPQLLYRAAAAAAVAHAAQGPAANPFPAGSTVDHSVPPPRLLGAVCAALEQCTLGIGVGAHVPAFLAALRERLPTLLPAPPAVAGAGCGAHGMKLELPPDTVAPPHTPALQAEVTAACLFLSLPPVGAGATTMPSLWHQLVSPTAPPATRAVLDALLQGMLDGWQAHGVTAGWAAAAARAMEVRARLLSSDECSRRSLLMATLEELDTRLTHPLHAEGSAEESRGGEEGIMPPCPCARRARVLRGETLRRAQVAVGERGSSAWMGRAWQQLVSVLAEVAQWDVEAVLLARRLGESTDGSMLRAALSAPACMGDCGVGACDMLHSAAATESVLLTCEAATTVLTAAAACKAAEKLTPAAAEAAEALAADAVALLRHTVTYALPLRSTELPPHSDAYERYSAVARALTCLAAATSPLHPLALLELLPVLSQPTMPGGPALGQLVEAAVMALDASALEALWGECVALVATARPTDVWEAAVHHCLKPALRAMRTEARADALRRVVPRWVAVVAAPEVSSLHSSRTWALLEVVYTLPDVSQHLGHMNAAFAQAAGVGGTPAALTSALVAAAKRARRRTTVDVDTTELQLAVHRCLTAALLATEQPEAVLCGYLLDPAHVPWPRLVRSEPWGPLPPSVTCARVPLAVAVSCREWALRAGRVPTCAGEGVGAPGEVMVDLDRVWYSTCTGALLALVDALIHRSLAPPCCTSLASARAAPAWVDRLARLLTASSGVDLRARLALARVVQHRAGDFFYRHAHLLTVPLLEATTAPELGPSLHYVAREAILTTAAWVRGGHCQTDAAVAELLLGVLVRTLPLAAVADGALAHVELCRVVCTALGTEAVPAGSLRRGPNSFAASLLALAAGEGNPAAHTVMGLQLCAALVNMGASLTSVDASLPPALVRLVQHRDETVAAAAVEVLAMELHLRRQQAPTDQTDASAVALGEEVAQQVRLRWLALRPPRTTLLRALRVAVGIWPSVVAALLPHTLCDGFTSAGEASQLLILDILGTVPQWARDAPGCFETLHTHVTSKGDTLAAAVRVSLYVLLAQWQPHLSDAQLAVVSAAYLHEAALDLIAPVEAGRVAFFRLAVKVLRAHNTDTVYTLVRRRGLTDPLLFVQDLTLAYLGEVLDCQPTAHRAEVLRQCEQRHRAVLLLDQVHRASAYTNGNDFFGEPLREGTWPPHDLAHTALDDSGLRAAAVRQLPSFSLELGVAGRLALVEGGSQEHASPGAARGSTVSKNRVVGVSVPRSTAASADDAPFTVFRAPPSLDASLARSAVRPTHATWAPVRLAAKVNDATRDGVMRETEVSPAGFVKPLQALCLHNEVIAGVVCTMLSELMSVAGDTGNIQKDQRELASAVLSPARGEP